jgi:hypothetical protein
MNYRVVNRKPRHWFSFFKSSAQQRKPSRLILEIAGLSKVILTAGAGLLVAVWLFIIIIGPRYPASQESLAKSESATNLITVALSNAMPDNPVRIDRRFGHNLDLYVNRKAFEEIPGPDRNDAVGEIGRAWCDILEYPWLPRVSLYDIQSGKRLATHICAFGKLNEAFFKPSSRSKDKQPPLTGNSPR